MPFKILEVIRGSHWAALRHFRHLVKRQFDYVACQQLRRSCGLHGLYSRLWTQDTLLLIIQRLSRRFLQRQRHFLVGLSVACPTTGLFSPQGRQWRSAEAKLPDKFMLDHKDDVDHAKDLTVKTLTCAKCRLRLVIDQKEPGVNYCKCEPKSSPVYGVKSEGTEWTPFLEREDIIVWRQPHPSESGMFIYMMYGRFEDVTPNEFLEVQLDLSEFRLTWDQNSAQVQIVEEEVERDSKSLSQIYYWEVNWPRFFSNRDYVCNRRTQIFDQENVGVVYSKATTHPGVPKKSKTFRVEDYWSVLCVKPLTKDGWDKPGVEFSLMAYENPGVSLPASITTWVAIRGMPEFMKNLRLACLRLRKERNQTKDQPQTLMPSDESRSVLTSTSTKSAKSGCIENQVESQKTTTFFMSMSTLNQEKH